MKETKVVNRNHTLSLNLKRNNTDIVIKNVAPENVHNVTYFWQKSFDTRKLCAGVVTGEW